MINGSEQQAPLGMQDQVSLEQNTTLRGTAQEPLGDDDSFSAAISAPEISMLALNATGETRYLGPSSGVPLASHAAATASSLVSCGSSTQPNASATSRDGGQSRSAVILTDQDKVQDEAEVDVLIHSYQTWIQPLYPLFEMEALCASMHEMREQEAAGIAHPDRTSKCRLQMAEYYLVLALGAIHHGRSTEQRRVDAEDLRSQPEPRRDPARLYLKSLEYFNTYAGGLPSSIPMIRVILLMCIYGFNGKVGNSQWQMAGFAMRVGFATLDSSNMLMILDGHRDRTASIIMYPASDRVGSRREESRFLDCLYHRDHPRVQPWTAAFYRGRAYYCQYTRHFFYNGNLSSSHQTSTDPRPHYCKSVRCGSETAGLVRGRQARCHLRLASRTRSLENVRARSIRSQSDLGLS